MTRDRLLRTSSLLGGIGALAFVIGLLVDPQQAYASYLAAYAAGLSVVLGALLLVMIVNLTGGDWFEPVRPIAETIAGTLPLCAVLFIPILLGLSELYPWARPPAPLAPELRESLALKGAYFDVPFFVGRAVVYFAIWLATSLLLRRWSAEAKRGGSEAPIRRRQILSACALPAVALALTFAAFDWVMSRSPEWFSTIYGVYYFAGGFLGALALIAVVAFVLGRAGMAPDLVPTKSYVALGKLLLTFVVFWAYIAYSQFFVIWIADIPAEVSWYIPRTRGSWGVVSLVLLFGQFALPFLLLLFRGTKTRPALLAAIGTWLLAMHYLDIYWLVLPELHPAGVQPHWLDLAGLLIVGGIAVAWVAWWLEAPTEATDPPRRPAPGSSHAVGGPELG